MLSSSRRRLRGLVETVGRYSPQLSQQPPVNVPLLDHPLKAKRLFLPLLELLHCQNPLVSKLHKLLRLVYAYRMTSELYLETPDFGSSRSRVTRFPTGYCTTQTLRRGKMCGSQWSGGIGPSPWRASQLLTSTRFMSSHGFPDSRQHCAITPMNVTSGSSSSAYLMGSHSVPNVSMYFCFHSTDSRNVMAAPSRACLNLS